jgi:hypothetical protein
MSAELIALLDGKEAGRIHQRRARSPQFIYSDD